jgi:hypothetical protein
MQIIKHRANTVVELNSTPIDFGVEIDIRSYGDELILHHDPFVRGEKLLQWIQNFRHKTLILNVKEEGLEDRLLEIMNIYKIRDFFFLDQSFPFLIRTSKKGEKRCAVRISEFESIDTALTLSGKIEWVWVDCFTHFPLCRDSANKLRVAGFKLCLVSPELQDFNAEKGIAELRSYLQTEDISPEAVCTKMPELWIL